MKSILGIIADPSAGLSVGPSNDEIESLLNESQATESWCIQKTKILKETLTNLKIAVPNDSGETILCQDSVDKAIKHANFTNLSLEGYNQSLIKSTKSLRTDLAKQQKAYANSVEVVKSFAPPDVIFSQTLQLRALSVTAIELVHTKIFEETSKLKDVNSFDIAVKRIPDVNTKNNQGRSAIDYATEHMFAHGIKALITKGANSSGALLYSLHMYLPEAAKLLVTLTSQLVGYEEIFSKLSEDNLLSHLDLSSTQLTPDAVVCLSAALAANNYLTLLNIGNNNIGAIGAKALSKMLTVNCILANLDISNANIGYEGIKYIATALESNSVVKVLNVRSNNLQEEGAITLARLIEKNNCIIDLDLASNNIMDTGAAYVIDRLSKNSSILRINLNSNNITDALAEDITEVLKQNSSILVFEVDSNKFSQLALLEIEETKCKVTEANLQRLTANYDLVDESYNIELLADLQQVDDFL